MTARWAYKLGKPMAKPELVEIRAGRFDMGEAGSKNEGPVHPVTFARPFYLAKSEITFAQYDAFCEATARARPEASWEGLDDQPVVDVSWSDALAYASWLSAMTGKVCRLPSEAEWEYAARSGTTTKYALPTPHGSDDIAGKNLANSHGCGAKYRGTAPVKSFPANNWKLHDMHGNVGEWIEDCWHDTYNGAPDDGRAWLEENDGECDNQMMRDGSWLEDPASVRSAARKFDLPEFRRYGYVGFRVLCSSPIE